jgi:hypothetical protein
VSNTAFRVKTKYIYRLDSHYYFWDILRWVAINPSGLCSHTQHVDDQGRKRGRVIGFPGSLKSPRVISDFKKNKFYLKN